MQPTRRTLLTGGATAALLLLLSHPASAAKPFLWKYFGAAPYALSREEAMRTRENAFHSLGLPLVVASAFMHATEQPGARTHITNGDRLTAMLSRGEVHHDVLVAFVRPPINGKMEYAAPAEMWQARWQGKVYTLILPEVCNNWSVIIGRSAHAGCYRIPLDYRQTPGVVWVKGAVRIEFHFAGMTELKLERLNRSPCFGVHDATGFHVPFHRCDVCETGEWPSPSLAKAVGLPEIEPRGVFTAFVAGGVGYVSVPRWATAYLGIYCVDVYGYAVSVAGFRAWTAISRFDIVPPSEMRRTLQKGRLDRTLFGERHY